MMKITYLKNGIYQESGYPVLLFEGIINNEKPFIHLSKLVEKLSKENFSFDFSSRPDLYELVNLDSVLFESKSKANILSKLYDNNRKFITSLDQKYWINFGFLTDGILKAKSGHIYSDDAPMSPIRKKLEDNLTIIFDKGDAYFDLDI